MKKEYAITGMSCNHCRSAVEKALNSMEGVSATVTLDPPAAQIEFSGDVKTLAQLQDTLSAAGDYTIAER